MSLSVPPQIFSLLFHVGSILAVTMTDPHVNGNLSRFVGICVQRSGKGLGATFILRNVVDGQGKKTLVTFHFTLFEFHCIICSVELQQMLE